MEDVEDYDDEEENDDYEDLDVQLYFAYPMGLWSKVYTCRNSRCFR